ncbi:unknown similar to AMEV049 [Adoxophyes honmai entomopoxvirus 'L']|uniref:Uncharacterized protein n=1 Tax=Adoxophyes honmai entomopoxvirus 'L' TaxID=1293540 RepID=A0A916KP06_9POXV|nr:unknown similar to AMEV049 [Adoxophyes honmai entomopoxvirus 'L']CCU55369.1 unknown similar to AMEV049 [Adoxophyes honmai entomopoxvirus 'L']
MLISKLRCKCGCEKLFIINIDFISTNNSYLTTNLFYYDNKIDAYILKKIYIVIYYVEYCNNFLNYFKIYNTSNNIFYNIKFNNVNFIKSCFYFEESHTKYFDVYFKQELMCTCGCEQFFKTKYFLSIINAGSFYRLMCTLCVEYKYKICDNFIYSFKIHENFDNKKNLVNLYADNIIWNANIYYNRVYCSGT